MRNKKILAALLLNCCFLTCASVTPAAIIGFTTPVKNPSTGIAFGSGGAGTLDATLGAPWVSYKLTLIATGGDLIQGVDVNIQGNLHQRWSASNSDSVYDTPTPKSSNATNADSHLLVSASAIIGAPPTEDNTFSGSPLSASNGEDFAYGIGHSLTGAWRVNGAAVTASDIAYIVVPKYAFPSIQVRVANSAGQYFSTLTTSDIGFDVPSIAVMGNNSFIPIGDTSPTLSDNTDFGSVGQNSVQQRVFTITNSSGVTLSLGSPVLTGPFSVVGSFPRSVDRFSTSSFTLGLDTATAGSFVGGISFANDAFLSPYQFSLAAKVVPEPAGLALMGIGLVGWASYTRLPFQRRTRLRPSTKN
jgi:hypothetical protein